MNILFTCSLLAVLLTGCSPSTKKCVVEDLETDKFTGIQIRKFSNNAVKTDQGHVITFDFRIGSAEGEIEKDHFLVLSADTPSFTRYFQIGDCLLLTLNGSETMRLELSCLRSRGKFSSYSNGSNTSSVYLPPEMVRRIVQAQSISFALQGSRYSAINEVTGVFQAHNMQNVRLLLPSPQNQP